MSTKAQLRAAIKRESRTLTNANLDLMIDEIVADIMRDYCNLARYHELLVKNHALTLVAGQQAYDLPADYQNLAQVSYGRGPNPSGFRIVTIQPESVMQTSAYGWPRFYQLVRGGTKGKLSFWPYNGIVVADILTIDYYVDPASLYTTEDAEFPIPRLESAVKKDAIARVQRFHSSLEEGQMTKADSQTSFSAAAGAT